MLLDVLLRALHPSGYPIDEHSGHSRSEGRRSSFVGRGTWDLPPQPASGGPGFTLRSGSLMEPTGHHGSMSHRVARGAAEATQAVGFSEYVRVGPECDALDAASPSVRSWGLHGPSLFARPERPPLEHPNNHDSSGSHHRPHSWLGQGWRCHRTWLAIRGARDPPGSDGRTGSRTWRCLIAQFWAPCNDPCSGCVLERR